MSCGDGDLSSGAVLSQAPNWTYRGTPHFGSLLVLQDFCVGLPNNFSVVPFLHLKVLNARCF